MVVIASHAFRLIPHPDTPPHRRMGIDVTVARQADGAWLLYYRLQAELQSLRVPTSTANGRTDGLWRQTCFEAFIAAEQAPAYREFNFSPSGQWQAYDFIGYRQHGRPADMTPPRITCHRTEYGLECRVALAPYSCPAWSRWRLGLSAVVEWIDGGVSYWALRHPPGRPDFHHADAFLLDERLLAAPQQSSSSAADNMDYQDEIRSGSIA